MADNLSDPPDRQGIKMDPTDDAHLTTHQPPETAYQVNVGPKANKGGDADPYPNTDDNRFTASGRDANIIAAKRKLRDGLQ